MARECDNDYPRRGQGDGTDSHIDPNEEFAEVLIVDFDRLVEEGRSDLNAEKSKVSAEYFEDGNATAQDSEYESVRYNNKELESYMSYPATPIWANRFQAQWKAIPLLLT